MKRAGSRVPGPPPVPGPRAPLGKVAQPHSKYSKIRADTYHAKVVGGRRKRAVDAMNPSADQSMRLPGLVTSKASGG